MRTPLPSRSWRKVVAATQGVTLTVAAADFLPLLLTQVVLVGALAMLAESFGRDVRWLWRHRDTTLSRATAIAAEDSAEPGPRRGRVRTGLAVVLTILAALIVWAALVAPHQPKDVSAGAFARLPLEALVVLGIAILLPAAIRRPLAWIVGPVLGLLVLVKALDIGFYTAFDRPFNPVDDWQLHRDRHRDAAGLDRPDAREPGRRRHRPARRRHARRSRPWRCVA